MITVSISVPVLAAGTGFLNVRLTDTDLLPKKVTMTVVDRNTMEKYNIQLSRMDGYHRKVELPAGSYYTEPISEKDFEIETHDFDIGVDSTKKLEINTNSTVGAGIIDSTSKIIRKSKITIFLIMLTAAGLAILKKKEEKDQEQ